MDDLLLGAAHMYNVLQHEEQRGLILCLPVTWRRKAHRLSTDARSASVSPDEAAVPLGEVD